MVKLEIIKQCQRSFHLFQLFTQKNKPIIVCAFAVENLFIYSLFINKL